MFPFDIFFKINVITLGINWHQSAADLLARFEKMGFLSLYRHGDWRIFRLESQKRFIGLLCNGRLLGERMRRSDFTKAGKFAAFRNLMIFNFAAVVGFTCGTVAFESSIFLLPNPTFAWLFSNVIGGLSHFGANWTMQGQKNEIGKCFIIFNVTGIMSFVASSATFAVAILALQNSTVAWLLGSLVGTLSHFAMNYKAMKIGIKK